jgi:chromosome segregation ATPase
MKIKTFEAKNFKGLENIAFELSEIEVIQGPNGVGKTSILDAISWVLYGTDSEGHDNFEIKPVSLEGTGVIVSVELKLELKDSEVTLRKELHEKISSEGVLKGNTYKYYIDGIPVSAADWGDWLKDHRPKLYEIRTNPLALGKLHWKERRKMLSKLVDFEAIEKEIRSKYNIFGDFEGLKTKLRGEIDKLEKSIAQYQPRIDEAQVVNVEEVIFTQQDEESLKNLNEGIELIQEQRKSLALKIQQLRDEDRIKAKVERLKAEEKWKNETEKLNELRKKQADLIEKINKNEIKKSTYTFAESNLEKEIEKLRNQYRAAQDVGTCPVTGDACETQKVLQKLQKNSEKELIKTTEIGLKLKEKIEAAKKEIEDLDVEHEALKKQLADVELEIEEAQKNLSPMAQVDIIANPRIAELEAELDALPTSFLKYDELKAKKAAFETYEKAVEKSKERIELLRAEWRAQSAKLQNKKSELKNIEACKQEIADNVESKVNVLFEGVCRWQMFNRYINGNLTPDCQLFVEDNSVEKPWEALNHGAQVWAGLKIINRLNELLEDEPWPVLIDNAESVNGLMNLNVNYQLILTYVIQETTEEQNLLEFRKKSKILPFN